MIGFPFDIEKVKTYPMEVATHIIRLSTHLLGFLFNEIYLLCLGACISEPGGKSHRGGNVVCQRYDVDMSSV